MPQPELERDHEGFARYFDNHDGYSSRIHGIPWVNTLAADDKGQTLYMNLSVVPYVDAAKLAQCGDPRAGQAMVVLDGSRSDCN